MCFPAPVPPHCQICSLKTQKTSSIYHVPTIFAWFSSPSVSTYLDEWWYEVWMWQLGDISLFILVRFGGRKELQSQSPLLPLQCPHQVSSPVVLCMKSGLPTASSPQCIKPIFSRSLVVCKTHLVHNDFSKPSRRATNNLSAKTWNLSTIYLDLCAVHCFWTTRLNAQNEALALQAQKEVEASITFSSHIFSSVCLWTLVAFERASHISIGKVEDAGMP